MDNQSTVYIIVMLFCIIMSGYFSATETAFSSFNRTKIKAMAEKGNKRAEKVIRLSESFDKLISTILIGNNIVNILLASIGTIFFIKLCGEDIGATVSTVVITVVVLVFGEVSPKSIAKDCPERFAMFSAPFISILITLLTPLNFLFGAWKKLLARVLRIQSDTKLSQEELLMLVDEVEQDGSIDNNEGDLLRNVIEFKELRAEDILTHRVDIEAVPENATKEQIAEAFTKTQFSRLLVYGENIDNVIGIIHQKDFYGEHGITRKPLRQIITAPVYIHKYEKISDILKELQKKKSHIAVVIDEYGGTLGIVTMEDILEELVGEIWDEHDEVVENFKKTAENTYMVDCTVNFDDFCTFFDIEPDSESVSLSGWIMEQLERIPEIDDTFTYENLSITVNSIVSHRAEYVTVVKKEITEEG